MRGETEINVAGGVVIKGGGESDLIKWPFALRGWLLAAACLLRLAGEMVAGICVSNIKFI